MGWLPNTRPHECPKPGLGHHRGNLTASGIHGPLQVRYGDQWQCDECQAVYEVSETGRNGMDGPGFVKVEPSAREEAVHEALRKWWVERHGQVVLGQIEFDEFASDITALVRRCGVSL